MLRLSCRKCAIIFNIDCIDNIRNLDYTPERLSSFISKIKLFFCPTCGERIKELP